MPKPSANEQFMLQLVNRARLLADIQPVAFNGDLNKAAESHSRWMISTDAFSHTGSAGSDADDRMKAAGYRFTGSWTWGENIAWASTRSPAGYQDDVQGLHTLLMNSASHRANILNGAFKEIGIGVEVGSYKGYAGAFVTENFARSGSSNFVTGVVFNDKDGDRLYDIGEGLGGVKVQAATASGAPYSTTTYGSGGYDLALPSGVYTVTFSRSGNVIGTREVTLKSENVKVDLVDSVLSRTFGQTAKSNNPASKSGDNRIEGSDGADVLKGFAGDDVLLGGSGDDVLIGGLGRDILKGGVGADRFEFYSAGETGLGARRDVILDFRRGTDEISLRGIDADRDTSGNQAFSWVKRADLDAPFTGKDGQLRFEGGILMGDVNGDKHADFHIKIVGSLLASDVIL